MRLYLYAKSTKNIGYTPDWIQITNKDGVELTLDIRGEIDYNPDGFDCRVKGDLIPWNLIDKNGEENDLSELDEDNLDKLFPPSTIIDFFANGTNFVVGVYPVKDDDETCAKAENDKFRNCYGKIEMCAYDKNDEDYERNFIYTVDNSYCY